MIFATSKINKEVENASKAYIEEINKLKLELTNALNEIERLKSQISTEENKVCKIAKLTNQISKDSTNSGIPTGKEIKKQKQELIYITIEKRNIPELVVNFVIKEKL